MNETHVLTATVLDSFRKQLIADERSRDTIAKYLRDVRTFCAFLQPCKIVDKEAVMAYKKHLAERYKGSSANSMLVAVNCLLAFLGWGECRVKLLRMQRQNFRQADRELTKDEYQRLLHAAKNKQNERLYLLMQTICATGIRVSEHRFITVAAIKTGYARIVNKGKERVVFIPAELKGPLLRFCRAHGVEQGSVFVSRSGRPLDRSNIWADMKRLSQKANVPAEKIFPHNLRHLFAITYYQLEKDIIRLADILGHSSVETTRIYTATSGAEQKKLLSRLGLIECG
ncbi:tyrosine-type recombinase/integrase [Agathobaculum sp. NTUH-O15-33]|uniref:tyrosine-type recombinase/integrase n=1 Tax=Agathobaculum sp. NTUH-O15-33 TaxID=3079302 RepID=UPI002958D334|nr:tyrosine-type recombinase/integrase [Agathobaculum sp. NTUH-O15-33]WNX83354.1 tyrosine-type recombinase/integrase [Agathobaculum sp. NTUH-O15-33]